MRLEHRSGNGLRGRRRSVPTAGIACLVVLVATAACSGHDEPSVDLDRREPMQLRRGLGAEPDTLDPRLAEDTPRSQSRLELHEA